MNICRPKQVLYFGICVACISAIYLVLVTDAKHDPDREIEVTQIAPVPTDSIVEIDPGSGYEFVYSVRNVGDTPLTEVKLNASCKCEIVQDIRRRLLPGEASQISLLVKSPNFGTTRQRVAITANGRVLEDITSVVRSRVLPPQLVSGVGNVALRFVDGDELPQHLEFCAAELSHLPPWITKLDCANDDDLLFELKGISEKYGPDKDWLFRTYQFEVVCRSQEVGEFAGIAKFQHCDEALPKLDPFAIRYSMLPKVDIFPKKLRVVSFAGNRTVLVPDRLRIVNRVRGDTRFRIHPCDANGIVVAEEVSAGAGQVSTFQCSIEPGVSTDLIARSVDFEIEGVGKVSVDIEVDSMH